MLEQAQRIVEGMGDEPEALRGLQAQPREIRELWHPHIDIEEKHFDVERLGEMLPVEEHERISGEMGKLSMERAEPLHLVVPFALHNLPADERATLTRRASDSPHRSGTWLMSRGQPRNIQHRAVARPVQ